MRNCGITCHCNRFQGTVINANGLAVRYTSMKDMVYLFTLIFGFDSVKF